MTKPLGAEFIGTFWLVLGGCGSAVLAAAFPNMGIGLLGVSLAIGLGLTLIHLISIPVTNTSVNPARSTGPALFVGGWALSQLWLFWVAPILGAAVAGVTYKWLGSEDAWTRGLIPLGRAPSEPARCCSPRTTASTARSRWLRALEG